MDIKRCLLDVNAYINTIFYQLFPSDLVPICIQYMDIRFVFEIVCHSHQVEEFIVSDYHIAKRLFDCWLHTRELGSPYWKPTTLGKILLDFYDATVVDCFLSLDKQKQFSWLQKGDSSWCPAKEVIRTRAPEIRTLIWLHLQAPNSNFLNLRERFTEKHLTEELASTRCLNILNAQDMKMVSFFHTQWVPFMLGLDDETFSQSLVLLFDTEV